MASWNEIERVRKDPKGFRALAKSLMASVGDELTDWESAFLDSVILKPDKDSDYSTRQSEKLLQIRDDGAIIETVRGFSVNTLLIACHLARVDLCEEDEDWIVAIVARSRDWIKKRDAARLLRIARELNIIEDDEE